MENNIERRTQVTTRDAFIAVNRFGFGARRGDLTSTTDTRALFKAVLAGHLGLPEAEIERRVFPGSGASSRLRDLFRA